jgi:hypothetical protein
MNDGSELWNKKYSDDDTPPIVSNIGIEVNHPKYSMETISRELSGNHEFVLNLPSGGKQQSIIDSN